MHCSFTVECTETKSYTSYSKLINFINNSTRWLITIHIPYRIFCDWMWRKEFLYFIRKHLITVSSSVWIDTSLIWCIKYTYFFLFQIISNQNLPFFQDRWKFRFQFYYTIYPNWLIYVSHIMLNVISAIKSVFKTKYNKWIYWLFSRISPSSILYDEFEIKFHSISKDQQSSDRL